MQIGWSFECACQTVLSGIAIMTSFTAHCDVCGEDYDCELEEQHEGSYTLHAVPAHRPAADEEG